MRCAICDRLLSEPNFNKDIETWEPCDTCMEVILQTLSGYHDRPAVEDDELGDEPLPQDDLSKYLKSLEE